MKKILCSKILFGLVLAILTAAGSASAEPWKFGVMSDTQWTTIDPANKNPYTVPVSIINQINQQFINAGVKFVIQVGDLSDNGQDISEVTRAVAAQPLIDAGIGFFPMRGNHETYGTSNSYGIPIFQHNYPQTETGTFTKTNATQYKLGSDFSSPTMVSNDLAGMSYSFDYGDQGNDARFIIIDPWATPNKVDNNPDGYAYGYTVNDQQPWISSRLDKNTRGTNHAFVFSHQPLIAENHQDTMFSGYTNANPVWQNTFFASLQDNGVKYFMSGHDHIHQRSIITSPDGISKVEELITASNSSKFYTPKPLNDSKWYGQKVRETSISQEAYSPGYYIYTVDGPCVSVDYYSDDHGNWQSDASYPNGSDLTYPIGITPTFNFVKKETWGYCQNGKEFLVPQAATYTTVEDSFGDTTAQILDGTNNSTARDGSLNITGGVGRQLTKAVNTGWVPKNNDLLDSDILKLWGMTDLGKDKTDTYVLAMTYQPGHSEKLGNGGFGIATKDANGNWVNAVDKVNATPMFVKGPWKASYGPGTYGVDASAKTAWAVIDYDGSFAVANGIEPVPGHRK